jgi:hypothetical protein
MQPEIMELKVDFKAKASEVLVKSQMKFSPETFVMIIKTIRC